MYTFYQCVCLLFKFLKFLILVNSRTLLNKTACFVVYLFHMFASAWCLQFCLPSLSILILMGEKVSAELHFKEGWNCKRYKNKAEMKTCKKTTQLQNDNRKESQEDYLISAVYSADIEWSSCLSAIVL